jgi:hypothetical protein
MRQPSSYCYGPIVQGRLLTHDSGGDHGGVEGLRQGFPSPAGCREELLDPPDLMTATAAACSMFCEKEICPLGFSRRGDFIGKGAASGGGPGGLTTGGRSQGLGRPPGGEVGPPPSHLWSSRSFGKKRRFGFCFVQFREYFPCNFSETQKLQKTGNWHCGILLIG